MSQDLWKVSYRKNRNTKKFSTKFLLIRDKKKSKFQKPIASNTEADNYKPVQYNTALTEGNIQTNFKKS
jgi:hypothetical protein